LRPERRTAILEEPRTTNTRRNVMTAQSVNGNSASPLVRALS